MQGTNKIIGTDISSLLAPKYFEKSVVGVIGTLGAPLPIYNYDMLIELCSSVFLDQGHTEDDAMEMAVNKINEYVDFINGKDDAPIVAAKQDANAEITMENGEQPLTINGEEWVILTPSAFRGAFDSKVGGPKKR